MPSPSDPLRKGRKYPGRDRVVHRDDARDYLYNGQMRATRRDECSQPYEVHAIGLPGLLEASGPLPVVFAARCRKCPECLAHRRRLWTARAVDEIWASNRTWFGTLTVRPEERLRIAWTGERAMRQRGWSEEDLTARPPGQTFTHLCNLLGKEVTKWLKRVRKNAGPLRYLLVFEAHKDGFPHCHILLHETATPVRKIDLERQWKHGFSHWRLVERDEKAAVYACKYLSKDAQARLRASQSYGQTHLVRRIADTAEKVVESFHQYQASKASGPP